MSTRTAITRARKIMNITANAETLHRAGQGNWEAFRSAGIDLSKVMSVAESWAQHLRGVERPWLCWNVDEDWCLVQQRLVASVGWTPVVGFDPRVGAPRQVTPGAIVIDFNEGIGLPVLYPHFPLEFLFLFADRLAFWHSDLLLRFPVMQAMAHRLAALRDGQTAATKCNPGLRHIFTLNKQRYWELIGCTTRKASRLQFENGCGWWMAFHAHPNCPPDKQADRQRYYWDHGAGIYYWHKAMRGDVVVIRDKAIHDGHFTKIGKQDYRSAFARKSPDSQRSMNQELNDNFDLANACSKMGLTSLIA